MNKLIIISGCSGGGKSTLLAELSHLGYTVMPEVGREVYKEKYLMKVDVTTSENQILICEEIIKRAIKAYEQAMTIRQTKDNVIFFDRSFLECVSYYQDLKWADSHKYDSLIHDYKYYPVIFITPPWKEIFSHDDERRHSFEDSVAEYEKMLEFYVENNYQTLEIPKLGVKDRAKFVLDIISGFTSLS
jgi:predicted ATPase